MVNYVCISHVYPGPNREGRGLRSQGVPNRFASPKQFRCERCRLVLGDRIAD